MAARGERLARFLRTMSRVPGARIFTRLHARLYVVSRGRLGKRWFGSPVLVLVVRGRRSGKLRRTPLVYTLDNDTPVVLAANAGHPRMPTWWLNARDTGRAVVHLRGDRREVVPRLVEGEERQRLWEQFAREAPSLSHYPTFTERPLPLVALEPAGRAGATQAGATQGGTA